MNDGNDESEGSKEGEKNGMRGRANKNRESRAVVQERKRVGQRRGFDRSNGMDGRLALATSGSSRYLWL